MAYDEALADRVRGLIEHHPGMTEKRMFGGIAFLIDGNMAVAAAGEGGLMVRVHPDEVDAAIAQDGVARMVMGGREMTNWLLVEGYAITGDDQLGDWVDSGVAFARSLPAK